ncbi:uncharacterized protein [Watersipora subatra]|uniref:uncharacterized protein isoform X2 n=1 Tax=Watersipora subatra TaxID=2589382 RepID=UPI00355BB902
MSEVTTEQTWGGLSAVELGCLIGGIALAIVVFIIVLTIIYVVATRSNNRKPSKNDDDNEKMVNMQTSRIVGGQSMQQVIVKSQPNGNMDKYTSPNDKLQTMDLETNTVRYDTDSQPLMVEAIDISKTTDEHEDADSGTGDSPTRTAVVIHSDGEDKDERESHSDEDAPEQEVVHHMGEDNSAYSSDEEQVPHYPMPPPPPVTDPPPPTPGIPGIPVTDLDDGETVIVPPPPPPPEDIYAEINRNRGSEKGNSTTTAAISPKQSFYRDAAEIQIIEREKF